MSIRDLIFKHCKNPNIISKGLAIYQKGEVKNLSHRYEAPLSYHTADILEQKTIITLKGDNLEKVSCSCKEEALCIHSVALLRALNENLTPSHQVSKKDLEVSKDLIKAYQEARTLSLIAPRYALYPELDIDPYLEHFTLSFKIIAQGRRYIIKSLQHFYEALSKKEVLIFGKNTEVFCHPNYFTKESQFFLKLIETNCGITEKTAYLHTNTHKIGRYLPLMPHQFDQVFEEVLKTTTTLPNAQKENGQYHFKTNLELAELSLTLKEENGYYALNFLAQNLSSIGEHYLLKEDKLYRLTQMQSQSLLPLLKTQNKEKTPLYLTKEQFSFFANAILPNLSSFIHLESFVDLSQFQNTPELKISLYLNLPSESALSARMLFNYGNLSFNPLLEENYPESLIRDIKKEEEVLAFLKEAHFTPNEDEWLLTGENHLYQFLSTSLPTLMADSKFDLKIEDRLSLIKTEIMPKQTMAVSVTKGIIEINFDENKYTTEELLTIIETYREGKTYVKLSKSRYLDLLTPEVRELSELLETLGVPTKKLKEGKITLSASNALTLDNLELKNHYFDFDKTFENVVKHYTKTPPEYPLPKGLRVPLRSYQKKGYFWLLHLKNLGLGGILADDMGLGKTIQSLSYLMKIREENQKANFLVIVPTSLLYNWESEAQNFVPELSPIIISGTQEKREEKLKTLNQGVCIITSYATLRKDFHYYEKMAFHSIFVDEAQYIKNSYTQNSKVCKLLKSEFHFALTGTPVENSLADLWSIMDFANPGYLKTWQYFKHVFEIPITRYEDEERLRLLQRQISPFILRRIKNEVAKELPEKIESNLFVTLSEEEEKIYHAQLARSQKTFVEENLTGGGGSSKIRILALLMRLRQASCSPSLFLENFHKTSSKLERCLAIVEEKISTGSQILIFSQFTSMLELIAKELDKKEIPYLSLTGKTKTEERPHLVNRFSKEKIPVFLISLKAGGVGLNLTSADTVIHFDPWWNQSVENQATDRTHRIGQDKNVQVIRLIAKNTIEEKILTLKKRKEALAGAIISGEETFLSTLSSDDLKVLFDLDPYEYH